jgi:CRISPR system Cascade subunit CasE
MIDLPLDGGRLIRFAAAQGHRGIDEDYGYCAHAWLTGTLHELAPRSFRLIDKRGRLQLLGYTNDGIDALRQHATAFALPAAYEVCDWAAAASKPMPVEAFRSGRALGFEVRACPIVRGEKGERDAFLAELDWAEAHRESPKGRSDVLIRWLRQRMLATEAVAIESVTLVGLQRVRGMRKSLLSTGAKRVHIERPDALFCGVLRIVEQSKFVTLLMRGVGRHRAFGYGMLLLRPTR